MQIELVNHGKIEAEAGAPLIAVIAAADKELAKKACVAKINGQLADLRTGPADGDTVEVFGPQDEEGLRTLRHTASHVMAQAVKRLFPAAKLAIGPAIDDGFYYDFDVEQPFSEEDLAAIEAEMKKIVKENIKLEAYELTPEEAVKFYQDKGEVYKVELIEEHAGKGENIKFYRQAEFDELCAGPHLMSTGRAWASRCRPASKRRRSGSA